MRRREFQEAMETVQSGPTAEIAPGQENPSKLAEGAPRTRQTKDLSGKLIYGGLGVILLCAIFNVVFKQRDPPWLKVHNETGAEVLRWFDYDEKTKSGGWRIPTSEQIENGIVAVTKDEYDKLKTVAPSAHLARATRVTAHESISSTRTALTHT